MPQCSSGRFLRQPLRFGRLCWKMEHGHTEDVCRSWSDRTENVISWAWIGIKSLNRISTRSSHQCLLICHRSNAGVVVYKELDDCFRTFQRYPQESLNSFFTQFDARLSNARLHFQAVQQRSFETVPQTSMFHHIRPLLQGHSACIVVQTGKTYPRLENQKTVACFFSGSVERSYHFKQGCDTLRRQITCSGCASWKQWCVNKNKLFQQPRFFFSKALNNIFSHYSFDDLLFFYPSKVCDQYLNATWSFHKSALGTSQFMYYIPYRLSKSKKVVLNYWHKYQQPRGIFSSLWKNVENRLYQRRLLRQIRAVRWPRLAGRINLRRSSQNRRFGFCRRWNHIFSFLTASSLLFFVDPFENLRSFVHCSPFLSSFHYRTVSSLSSRNYLRCRATISQKLHKYTYRNHY